MSKAALLAERLQEFQFFIGPWKFFAIKVKNLRSFDVIESWLRTHSVDDHLVGKIN